MKRLSGLAAMAAGAGILWATAAGWNSPVLHLDKVEVVGARAARVSSAGVAFKGGLIEGTHLLKLSTRQAEKRIETIPWVAEAEVRRILPSTVRVTIKERRAFLVVVDRGRSYLVDAHGKVLERGEAGLVKVLDLPLRAIAPGTTIATRPFRHAVAIIRSLDPGLRKEVSTIRASSVDGITLNLSDGTSILFGAAEQLHAKNFAIGTLMAEHRQRSAALQMIDVRVPTRAAVMVRKPPDSQ